MKKRGLLAIAALITLLCLSLAVGCGKKETAPERTDYSIDNLVELPEPAETIDVVPFNLDNDKKYGMFSATVLQGMLNKKQPRVYFSEYTPRENVNVDNVRQRILQEYGDVELNFLEADTETMPEHAAFWTLFRKYHEEVKMLYVYSSLPELNDTMNVAAMLAGRNEGVAVSHELAEKILEEGYDIPVVDVCEEYGFTGENANTMYINAWIRDNMFEGSNKKMVFILYPGINDNNSYFTSLYDLAIATDSLIYHALSYMEAGEELQRSILDKYEDGTIVIGWPGLSNENDYIRTISKCGKTAVCPGSVYRNGSLWGAFPSFTYEGEKPVNEKPDDIEVYDDKVYVSFVVSDGDAWHFAFRDLIAFWEQTTRGIQPIGWTIPSLFCEFNPLILEYLYDTKTDKDDFMQGPSGIGYGYPSYMPDDSYQVYLKQTASVFDRLGLNMVNYWDLNRNSNAMVGDDETTIQEYADAVDLDLIIRGHDSQTGDYKWFGDTLAIESMGTTNGNGTWTAQEIIAAIDRRVEASEPGKPVFLNVNVEAWGQGVHTVQEARDLLDERDGGTKYVFLTPSEMVAAIEKYEAGASQPTKGEEKPVKTLQFDAIGDKTENRFLYQNSGSSISQNGVSRFADGYNSWVYKFSFPSAIEFCQVSMKIGQEFIISGSTDGVTFTELTRYMGIKTYPTTGHHYTVLDIVDKLSPTDTFYLKFEDAVKTNGNGAVLSNIRIRYILEDGGDIIIPESGDEAFIRVAEAQTGQTFAMPEMGSSEEMGYITEGYGLSTAGAAANGDLRRYANDGRYWVYGFDMDGEIDELVLMADLHQKYRLSVSTDGSTWSDVASSNADARTTVYFVLSDVLAGADRFWLKIENRIEGVTYGVALYGLQMAYTLADGTETEVSPAEPYAAEYEKSFALHLGDSLESGFLYEDEGSVVSGNTRIADGPAYWIYGYDFGEAVTGAAFKIRARAQLKLSYKWDDAEEWTELAARTGETIVTEIFRGAFTGGGTKLYLRFEDAVNTDLNGPIVYETLLYYTSSSASAGDPVGIEPEPEFTETQEKQYVFIPATAKGSKFFIYESVATFVNNTYSIRTNENKDEYVIAKFDMRNPQISLEAVFDVTNEYLVSFSLDNEEYTPILKYDDGNLLKTVDLTEYLGDETVFYLKFTDGNPYDEVGTDMVLKKITFTSEIAKDAVAPVWPGYWNRIDVVPGADDEADYLYDGEGDSTLTDGNRVIANDAPNKSVVYKIDLTDISAEKAWLYFAVAGNFLVKVSATPDEWPSSSLIYGTDTAGVIAKEITLDDYGDTLYVLVSTRGSDNAGSGVNDVVLSGFTLGWAPEAAA